MKQEQNRNGSLGHRWRLMVGIVLGAAVTSGATEPLIAPTLLDEVNLEIVWQRPLPIEQNETIEQFVLREDRLYILTDRNYLISLLRSDGRTIFSKALAPIGYEIQGWDLELDSESLVLSSGDEVTSLACNTGTIQARKKFDFCLACPPTRNSSMFFLAGDDRRLHCIQRDTQIQYFDVSALSDTRITAAYADERGSLFGTQQGDILALTAGEQPLIRWQFEAEDTIVGPVTVEEDAVFFASRDSYVYRLNVDPQAQRLVWRSQCEALLDQAPWVTDTTLYQRVGYQGIAALDKATGRRLWFWRGARALLAQSTPRSYLFTEGRHLVVMDHEKGTSWRSIATPTIAYTCTNTTDAMLYMTDDQGRILCLKPADRN